MSQTEEERNAQARRAHPCSGCRWRRRRRQQNEPPDWAYNVVNTPAGAKPAPDDGLPKKLPGSSGAFTLPQIRDGFGPADWYPGDHPTMPPIVARGRKPDMRACSLCHYPNGKGRPENAGVAGLPAQLLHPDDGRLQERRSRRAPTRARANTNIMIAIAKAMTDEEIDGGGGILRLDEVDAVDQGRRSRHGAEDARRGGMFLKLEGNGHRADRQPDHRDARRTPKRTEVLRDPRSGFIAYVPRGSIEEGQGAGHDRRRGQDGQCSVCHGADLKGLGPVPGLAGRSPSYIGPPAVRHAAGRAQGRVDRADEAGRQEADPGRHAGHRGVHGVARAMNGTQPRRREDKATV